MPRQLGFAAVVFFAVACNLVSSDLDADGPILVTCGSVIKLQHDKLKHHLHSHEVAYGYGRGSGQQSVTGFPGKDSADSFWAIKVGQGSDCPQGSPIAAGTVLRLQHTETSKWLHSHHFSSPLSGSQEVSCFGSDDETDSGDLWQVEWDGKAKAWERDQPVRLKHVETGVYLATHDVKYQRPIPGHTEVFGSKVKAPSTVWKATEGVYFPQRSEA